MTKTVNAISVLMTTYNDMPFTPESVKSILEQSFKNMELLIINDGSTDGTKDYLDSLSDDRIRVIHLSQNRGRTVALNVGIREALHDWIAIQDADDIALPHRMVVECEFLNENPEYVLVSGAWAYIRANGDRLKGAIHRPRLQHPPDYNPHTDGAICHTASLFRKDAALAIGGYREVVGEDFDFWVRLADASYRMASIEEVVALYRVYRGGNTLKKFMGNRMSWAYTLACSRARKAGEEEPDQEEFLRENWPRGWQRILLEGQRQWRLGGSEWGDGRSVRALGHCAISFLLNPKYVLTKIRVYFFTRADR